HSNPTLPKTLHSIRDTDRALLHPPATPVNGPAGGPSVSVMTCFSAHRMIFAPGPRRQDLRTPPDTKVAPDIGGILPVQHKCCVSRGAPLAQAFGGFAIARDTRIHNHPLTR